MEQTRAQVAEEQERKTFLQAVLARVDASAPLIDSFGALCEAEAGGAACRLASSMAAQRRKRRQEVKPDAEAGKRRLRCGTQG